MAQNSFGLYLSQRKYALGIISKTGLSGSKLAWIPIEQNHHLANVTGPFMSLPKKYCRVVGQLIYLTITRPELAYSIHTLAQFMTKSR